MNQEQYDFEVNLKNNMRLNTAYLACDVHVLGLAHMSLNKVKRMLAMAVDHGKIKVVQHGRFYFYYRGIPVVRE